MSLDMDKLFRKIDEFQERVLARQEEVDISPVSEHPSMKSVIRVEIPFNTDVLIWHKSAETVVSIPIDPDKKYKDLNEIEKKALFYGCYISFSSGMPLSFSRKLGVHVCTKHLVKVIWRR